MQGAVVGGALAASVVGLLGADGGILWIVAGVWTVRFVWGRSPGVAWGLVVLGSALRWGTLSAADVEASSRLLGPLIATEPVPAAVGASAALVAVVLEESKSDGLRERVVPVRAAAMIALVALVSLVCAPGPDDLASAGVWVAATGSLAVAVLALRGVARRIPTWVPPAVASAGVAVVGIAR